MSAAEEPKGITPPLDSTPLLNQGQRHKPDQDGDEAKAIETNNNGAGEQDEKQLVEEGDVKLDDYYRMGRYTLVVCALAQLMLLAEVGDLLFMTYAGAEPTVTACGTFTDFTTAAGKPMPPKARCERLNQLWKNGTGAQYGCFNWTSVSTQSDLTYQFHSVNVEFDDLFCKTGAVKTSNMMQLLGIIPGSIVFGWLSDAYGRRLVMLGALLCWICSMGVASLAGSLLMLTVSRFVVLFFNAGIGVTLIVYTSEMFPKKQRFCLMNLITWAPNYILFACVAYAFQDWRWLQRVLAVLALPCAGLILFLCESPRFLIASRRMEDAKRAIMRMHRIDGRHCDEAVLDAVLAREHRQMVEQSAKKKKYNYFHLFYGWEYARYTIAVSFTLFVVSLVTYTLVYNMDKLSGSIYLNLVLMGAFKYSMNLAIAFGDMYFKWLGRKLSHLISEVLVVAALALYIFMHVAHLKEDFPQIANWTLICAVGFCGVLFNAGKLAGSELFPTGVRNLSCSFGQVCSRIGVVAAPILFNMQGICDDYFCYVLPHLTMLALAVLDFVLFQCAVRETKGRPMISEFPSRKQQKGPA